MTKRKKTKKVIVTKPRVKPTTSRIKDNQKSKKAQVEMVFGEKNYKLMGLGILLIILGMALMTGGKMPSPDVWDDSLIYNFRRITLAPIVILAGLALEVYAILKK